MKEKILIGLIFLIFTTAIIEAEPIYDYGNYSVNNNVTISACINVNVDVLYANITKPDNTTKITSLSCGGTNYCQPSWIYCTGIFKNADVSGIYNVSFYSDRYKLSNSFKGYFTVFEGTFLNVTFPLNNSLTNNRTIIINGLTNGTNVSINKGGNNFTAIVVNRTFSFPLNLTEGENVINIAAYGKYRFQNSTALRIFLDTIPPEIRWINYSSTIRIYKTFRFALNITDNINLTYVSANMVLDDITENLFVYYVDGYYIINVEPTRTGDWILKIKACDSAGNCNESSFSYYAYRETENEEKPKISILPSNRTENVSKDENKTEYENKTKHENKTKETTVNTSKEVNKTKEVNVLFAAGPFKTLINTSKEINGTIIATPSNGTLVLTVNGKELKNFEFSIGNKKIKTNEYGEIENDDNKKIFLNSLRENSLRENINVEEILNEEGYVIGTINTSKKMQIINGILSDMEGNIIKENITIEFENGEKINIKEGIIGKSDIEKINKVSEEVKKRILKERSEVEDVIKAEIPENIKEGKVIEIDVKNNKGELIKNKEVEIILPSGEKIKVRTDENGKVRLTNKGEKIRQINTNVKIPGVLEGGKFYELEVKNMNGNVIKNRKVLVSLGDSSFEAETDENGKIKVKFENGKFEIVKEKQEFKFQWYYLLPLLLIPLLLYLILKEHVILSYGFYKKLKEENKLKELKKYIKIYMLKKYDGEINDLKQVIFIDSESEEQLAKKLKLKILK